MLEFENFQNSPKMLFLVTCFVLIANPMIGVSSKIITTTSTSLDTSEKSLDSGTTTTVSSIFDNVTEQTGKNVFESIEKFVVDLVAPADQVSDPNEGRTFGIKRLQFMLMPMMYKMGVMMTLLVVLTVISLKGLAVGVLLLVLKLSAFMAKFYANGHGSAHGWAPQPQPVHLHVHNNGGGGHNHGPYNAWESPSSYGPEDEHYYYKG